MLLPNNSNLKSVILIKKYLPIIRNGNLIKYSQHHVSENVKQTSVSFPNFTHNQLKEYKIS
jgi:hypothetical protein